MELDMTLEQIFEEFSKNPKSSLEHSFQSDEDLDNNAAMSRLVEENDLEGQVIEDLGTLITLSLEGFNFEIVIESYGLGSFFEHGFSIYRN